MQLVTPLHGGHALDFSKPAHGTTPELSFRFLSLGVHPPSANLPITIISPPEKIAIL